MAAVRPRGSRQRQGGNEGGAKHAATIAWGDQPPGTRRAVALSRQGKWPEAREKLKNVEFVIPSQPLDLQRLAMGEAMRASVEVKDFAGASAYAPERAAAQLFSH